MSCTRRRVLMLAGTEGCERFSFYGVRGLLVLFLTSSVQRGGLQWEPAAALRLLGGFTAFVYLLPVVGGLCGDRFMSPERAVRLGTAVLIGGYALLAVAAWLQHTEVHPDLAFVAALGIIAIGTGLFKPNITTLVGREYRSEDTAREGGFLIFYLFMNVGALLCGFVIGTLGETIAWSLGFFVAALAMFVSRLFFTAWRHRRKLETIAAPASNQRVPHVHQVTQQRARKLNPAERAAFIVIAGLGVFATLFWVGIDQMAGLLNLFAYHRTQRTLEGVHIPATWFQALNPLFIIILAPLFAQLWTYLARQGILMTTESKFAIGLLAMTIAFATMHAAATGPETALRSPLWLIGAYLFITVGELCIWTISLAAVTRLAPYRHASLVVGLWYLAIAVGGGLAGQVGALASRIPLAQVFSLLSGIFLAATMLIIAASPLFARYTRAAQPYSSRSS